MNVLNYKSKIEYMDEDYDDEGGNNWISWGTALAIGMAIGAVIFGKASKFEGMTAEEWFNEYDYTISCLQQIQDTANTYSNESYEEINDALYEISSKVDDCT